MYKATQSLQSVDFSLFKKNTTHQLCRVVSDVISIDQQPNSLIVLLAGLSIVSDN
jgi:hypothetical protein